MVFRIAELFAGIGGVASGFSDTGVYEPVCLTDSNPLARRAFLHNYPDYADIYTFGIVQNLTGPQLLESAGGQVDGILGCPPCQGFSAAGLRDTQDERNELLFDMHRIVWSADPEFFVLENVPSILNTSLFADFKESISRRYVLAFGVLNAAEFGVPQLRRRAIVIGFRTTMGVTPSLPSPTTGGAGTVFNYVVGRLDNASERSTRIDLGLSIGEDLPARPLISLEAALGDLPEPKTETGSADYLSLPASDFQRDMRRNALPQVHDHRAWRHHESTAKRLANVLPGDCPTNQGCRSRNTRYFSQAYARLHPHGLARTITTNFHNPGSGRFTHYAQPRTLTIREALRIQGFPDDFIFPPDIWQSDAEEMVGNAFPRLLAAALGKHIHQLLS